MEALACLILRGGLSPTELLTMGSDDPWRTVLLRRAIPRSDELRKEELEYLGRCMSGGQASS